MSYNLTREERETFINTSEADDYWDFYTDNAKYQKKLQKYAEQYPQWCRLISEDPELGFTTWRVDKKHFSFQLKKPRSEKQMQVSFDNARNRLVPQARAKKQSKS